ncbi:MAG: endolytic transglycosylase MltG [Candidatus Magasanikbacteria bacterium]|nr:endolytic transglycosylase MltG [Candidatus Magasanikbacteria bacterium]
MKIGKIFLSFFIAVIIFGWAFHTNAGTIVIQDGDSVGSVAARAASAGIVRSSIIFKIGYRIFGGDANIFPGVVKISSDCNVKCVVRRVTSSQRDTIRITLTEGQDLRDLARILTARGIGSASELYAIAGVPAGKKSENDYEGYLFPDSYDVPKDISTQHLVDLMRQNFKTRVEDGLKSEIAASGHSLHDVIIVASILEKEVRPGDDRRRVADLIWRRVAAGMPLQVDASVNYATGKENLFTTAQDRATDSPWNTYKYKGLPVGPIGNPGIDAIEAAMTPIANPYWFYLTGSDGVVHFAKNFDEQIANRKYLK